MVFIEIYPMLSAIMYTHWLIFYFCFIYRNSLVDYLLDGTAIKEALEHGKETNEKACEELYLSCPLDSKSATSILMKLLPKKQKLAKLKSTEIDTELKA